MAAYQPCIGFLRSLRDSMLSHSSELYQLYKHACYRVMYGGQPQFIKLVVVDDGFLIFDAIGPCCLVRSASVLNEAIRLEARYPGILRQWCLEEGGENSLIVHLAKRDWEEHTERLAAKREAWARSAPRSTPAPVRKDPAKLAAARARFASLRKQP